MQQIIRNLTSNIESKIPILINTEEMLDMSDLLTSISDLDQEQQQEAIIDTSLLICSNKSLGKKLLDLLFQNYRSTAIYFQYCIVNKYLLMDQEEVEEFIKDMNFQLIFTILLVLLDGNEIMCLETGKEILMAIKKLELQIISNQVQFAKKDYFWDDELDKKNLDRGTLVSFDRASQFKVNEPQVMESQASTPKKGSQQPDVISMISRTHFEQSVDPCFVLKLSDKKQLQLIMKNEINLQNQLGTIFRSISAYNKAYLNLKTQIKQIILPNMKAGFECTILFQKDKSQLVVMQHQDETQSQAKERCTLKFLQKFAYIIYQTICDHRNNKNAGTEKGNNTNQEIIEIQSANQQEKGLEYLIYLDDERERNKELQSQVLINSNQNENRSRKLKCEIIDASIFSDNEDSQEDGYFKAYKQPIQILEKSPEKEILQKEKQTKEKKKKKKRTEQPVKDNQTPCENSLQKNEQAALKEKEKVNKQAKNEKKRKKQRKEPQLLVSSEEKVKTEKNEFSEIRQKIIAKQKGDMEQEDKKQKEEKQIAKQDINAIDQKINVRKSVGQEQQSSQIEFVSADEEIVEFEDEEMSKNEGNPEMSKQNERNNARSPPSFTEKQVKQSNSAQPRSNYVALAKILIEITSHYMQIVYFDLCLGVEELYSDDTFNKHIISLSYVIEKLFEKQLLISYDFQKISRGNKQNYKGMVKIDSITKNSKDQLLLTEIERSNPNELNIYLRFISIRFIMIHFLKRNYSKGFRLFEVVFDLIDYMKITQYQFRKELYFKERKPEQQKELSQKKVSNSEKKKIKDCKKAQKIFEAQEIELNRKLKAQNKFGELVTSQKQLSSSSKSIESEVDRRLKQKQNKNGPAQGLSVVTSKKEIKKSGQSPRKASPSKQAKPLLGNLQQANQTAKESIKNNQSSLQKEMAQNQSSYYSLPNQLSTALSLTPNPDLPPNQQKYQEICYDGFKRFFDQMMTNMNNNQNQLKQYIQQSQTKENQYSLSSSDGVSSDDQSKLVKKNKKKKKREKQQKKIKL